MKKKRIFFGGDLHSGSLVGLTPPDWQKRFLHEDIAKHNKYLGIQRACWDFYSREVDKLKPFDIAVFNGDCIDGKGLKSGGTELIEPDRNKQCKIAEECIRYLGCSKIILLYGTAYHTGDREGWEDKIGEGLEKIGYEVKLGSHEWLDVNGVIFDIKHKVGSSTVPGSRHNATTRAKIWNLMWSEREAQPLADIYIRSHTHYHEYCGNPTYLSMTLPALQGMGSKYGSRECEGIVDFGFVHFDIDEKGGYIWEPHIARIKEQQAKTIKL